MKVDLQMVIFCLLSKSNVCYLAASTSALHSVHSIYKTFFALLCKAAVNLLRSLAFSFTFQVGIIRSQWATKNFPWQEKSSLSFIQCLWRKKIKTQTSLECVHLAVLWEAILPGSGLSLAENSSTVSSSSNFHVYRRNSSLIFKSLSTEGEYEEMEEA